MNDSPIRSKFLTLLFVCMALGSLMATACAGAPAEAPENQAKTEAELAESARLEAAYLEAQRAEKEKAVAFGAAQTKNDSGKTLLSKVSRERSYRTSHMLITKSGTVILVDPFLVIPGIEADVILSTHKDYDHNEPELYKRTSARMSLYTLESFTVKDVQVRGIAASHYGDDFDPLKPSDVIYLVEADGLRIAFMGDICQTSLTEAQLAELGRVDVAVIIMEYAPSYGYSAEPSLAMLRQLRPTYAFPIHPTQSEIRKIAAGLGGTIEAGHRFALEPPDPASESTKIVLLSDLPAY